MNLRFLKEITVKGHKLNVHLDQDSLWFQVDLDDGETVKASSLEALRVSVAGKVDAISKAKRKQVSVPIMVHDTSWRGDGGFRDGVITGIHSSTGKYMVRWNKSRTTEQIMNSHVLYRPLNTEELSKMHALQKKIETAEEEFREYKRKFVINEAYIKSKMEETALMLLKP